MGVRSRRGDVVQEGTGHSPGVQPRGRRREPLHVQRMVHGRAVDDGCRAAAVGVPQQGCEPGCVQRGGHGDDGEVAAERTDLREHADQEIRFQASFVHLIQDDGASAVKPGVCQQAAQQDARGDKLDPGLRARVAFPADRVADAASRPAAVERGEAAGGGAGGNTPRLGDDDAAARAVEVCQQRRDEGGFTRPGRCLYYGGARRAAVFQCLLQRGKGSFEGKSGTDGTQIERVGGGAAVRRNHPSILPRPASSFPRSGLPLALALAFGFLGGVRTLWAWSFRSGGRGGCRGHSRNGRLFGGGLVLRGVSHSRVGQDRAGLDGGGHRGRTCLG
ncbi:hypothetical protein QFZ57_003114 [Arthrobacter sp. B1I2]|nr:hypothetical protein [Arthrobacter sp. B1I2]